MDGGTTNGVGFALIAMVLGAGYLVAGCAESKVLGDSRSPASIEKPVEDQIPARYKKPIGIVIEISATGTIKVKGQQRILEELPGLVKAACKHGERVEICASKASDWNRIAPVMRAVVDGGVHEIELTELKEDPQPRSSSR